MSKRKKKSIAFNDIDNPKEFELWKGLYFLSYFEDFASVEGTHSSISKSNEVLRFFLGVQGEDIDSSRILFQLLMQGLCAAPYDKQTKSTGRQVSVRSLDMTQLSLTKKGQNVFNNSAFTSTAKKLRKEIEEQGFDTSSANVLLQFSYNQYKELNARLYKNASLDSIYRWIDNSPHIVPRLAWTNEALEESKKSRKKLSRIKPAPAGAPGKRRTVSRGGNTLRKTISLEESLAEAVKKYADSKGLSDSSAINDLLRENSKLAPFKPKPGN